MEPKRETRTEREIWDHVSGFLPGRSLGGGAYLEAAEGGIRIIPTGTDSKRLKAAGVDLSKVDFEEAMNIYEFLGMANTMEEMVILMRNQTTDEKRTVMPKEGSKYFQPGRQRMSQKVNRKMQKPKVPGRMITLTFDPLMISRARAWKIAGKELSRLIDAVKVFYRRRRAMEKVQYFWTIEEQEGTGYPHFHLFFQDETACKDRDEDRKGAGFIPRRLLLKWWGWGEQAVHIKFCRASIRKYIAKYIGKVKGMSINAMAHMWRNKRRLYGFSRDYLVKLPPKEKQPYDVVGMFHPVKGFGIRTGGEYYWAGALPLVWLADRIENPLSAGYIKLQEKLYEGEAAYWS